MSTGKNYSNLYSKYILGSIEVSCVVNNLCSTSLGETTLNFSLVDKSERTNSITDESIFARRRTGRLTKDVAGVSQSARTDSNLSIPCRSQELCLSQMTNWH